MITLITRVEAAICNRQLGSELRLLRFGVRKSSTNLDRSCSDPTVTLRPGSRPLKHTARIRIKKQLGASLLFPFPSLLLHHHHGSAPLLLRSSPHPSRRRSRPWRLPLVRDVSMLCSFWVDGEHEEEEGEVPDRSVRAGSKGERRRRRRRRAGRVAQPRRHARLRRGHHRRADHRQRRAPERGADVAGADGSAGAHRSGRRRHRVPHLPVGVAGLIE